MMDDSLSDTQQEKKMSVKELSFYQPQWDKAFKAEEKENKIVLSIWDKDRYEFVLDRSQAHLLMLYLQEHLKR